MDSLGLIIGIAIAILVIVGVLAFVVSRLKTVAPDEVLIVVALGGRRSGMTAADSPGGLATMKGGAASLADAANYSIHTAGRVFIVPVVQDYFTLSLKQRQVELDVTAQDSNFVPVAVTGNLSFKFSDDPAGVVKAAQRFSGHTDQELEHSIRQALEGTLRGICASMSYSDIVRDRASFQEKVLSEAKTELGEQGIQVDVLNVRSVDTPGSSYAADLAASELAAAEKNAKVAQAEARREAEFARITAAEQIAGRERDLSLKESSFRAETDRAKELAQAAGMLARAEQDALVAEQDQAALARRALVTQEQLDIDEKKPAEAAAYAAKIRAQGERDAAIAAADARAYDQQKTAEAAAASSRVRAEGERDAAKATADAAAYERQVSSEADAAATQRIAEAEAAAEVARGAAEAEVVEKVGAAQAGAADAKVQALSGYSNEALAYELVTRMPEIIKAAADGVSSIDSYTVVGTQGASDAVNQTTQILAQGLGMVKGTTGVDLGKLLSRGASGDDTSG